MSQIRGFDNQFDVYYFSVPQFSPVMRLNTQNRFLILCNFVTEKMQNLDSTLNCVLIAQLLNFAGVPNFGGGLFLPKYEF